MSRILPSLIWLVTMLTVLIGGIAFNIEFAITLFVLLALIAPIIVVIAFLISVLTASPNHESGHLDVKSNSFAISLIPFFIVSVGLAGVGFLVLLASGQGAAAAMGN